MTLYCPRCKTVHPPDLLCFRCDCGGLLEIEKAPVYDPRLVNPADPTLWRYRHALPLPEEADPVSLGEGMTPLVAAAWDGLPVFFKCEFLNPTGSFKDRGTTLLVSALAAAGVGRVVEDSSGNAGSSLAAYAARAGIDAAIYVPAHASPAKQAQIAAYGAQVVRVPGPRAEAARVVLEVVDRGAAYASHVYHPLILQGMKTVAFEICAQLAGAPGIAPVQGPDAVVLPVGHGSLLLGLERGFAELYAAGCLEQVPRLYGAQAAPCAPLAAAWESGAAEPVAVVEEETVAEGVRIAAPPRGSAVLQAVRGSKGALLSVPDEETLAAQRRLARQGFYVEPTSALAVAALDRLRADERQAAALQGTVVVILTGSGFKSPPTEQRAPAARG